jgi:4-hydroxy-tetrahydrodipicolinate reductase
MKVLLVGATGAMGKAVIQAAIEHEDIEIVAGIGRSELTEEFPLYSSLLEVKEEYEYIIDFSLASVTKDMLKWAIGKNKKIIVATTGLDDETYSLIDEAARTNAIIQAGNMSYGVNVLNDTVGKLASVLSDYEVEILECHHNKKVDAPSGTAQMLFESVKAVRNRAYKIFDRTKSREKRKFDEVYIASLRSGNIVGEHSVIFSNNDEIIEVKHRALSKRIFADGALRLVYFLKDKESGRFDIKDVIL